jgi:CheY-like chemotaxis protein
LNAPKILLLSLCDQTPALDLITKRFEVTCVASLADALVLAGELEYKLLLCDLTSRIPPDFSCLQQLNDFSREQENFPPVVVLSSSRELRDSLQAFELGVADYIGPEISMEEVCARLNRTIYHQIASEQLKDRLQEANATAYSVMSDNSDLGSNIQFLLGVNRCDNLDQLGQMFFTTVEHYRLSCSLQMRSLYQTKNMEANGMAKDLESELLSQMRDAGRYIDFGRRTIVNYGQASLLIRNMPSPNDARYGAIKDNTFALIQGIDARIKALDEHAKLLEEKQALEKLSQDVKLVMAQIDDSYQGVMRHIVDTVEEMAESIQRRIPTLALSEEQEYFFEDVAANAVSETNKIFNQGLHVDECFQRLSETMDRALVSLSHIDEIGAPPVEETDESGSVDLF